MKLDFYLIKSHQKINLKLIWNLKWSDPLKFLGKDIGKKFLDLSIAKDFLDIIPKA